MGRTKKQVETEIGQELKDILAAKPMVKDLGDMDEKMGGSAVHTLSVGDIIQVTAEPRSHKYRGWIGIVHSTEGSKLICYVPKAGNPVRFVAESWAVEAVGKARLKWSKPLPDDSTKDRSYLDKV